MQQQIETPGTQMRKASVVSKHVFRPRDVELLRVIRNATWITRQQIEMKMEGEEKREGYDSRNRRLRKLHLLGQIEIRDQQFPYPGRTIGVTRAGLRTLELIGWGLMSVTSESDKISNPKQIDHYLALNLIEEHIGKLIKVNRWLGDRELASLNIAANKPTSKDYDAVFEMHVGNDQDRLVRVGVEYERSVKARERYVEIRKALATEDQLRAVIYFVDHTGWAVALGTLVYSPKVVVLIVVLHDLARDGMRAPVRLLDASRKLVLAELGTVLASL